MITSTARIWKLRIRNSEFGIVTPFGRDRPHDKSRETDHHEDGSSRSHDEYEGHEGDGADTQQLGTEVRNGHGWKLHQRMQNSK